VKKQPTFEDRLSDWLEDGPVDAPDSVVETVLAAFPSIPQRRAALRVPWRFPLMNGYVRALAGIAAVAVIAVGGLIFFNRAPAPNVGAPSPTPSASATPSSTPSATPAPTPIDPTTWTPFTSTRHGETMRYPSDWIATAATAPWPIGAEGPVPPNPMLDVFAAPGGTDTPTFVVLSQPLPKGTTSTKWLANYESTNAASFPAQCWPAPAAMEKATVGGLQAWVHGDKQGCGFTEAIVFAGGRVYELSAYGNGSFTGQFDRALFDAFLSTIKIDPSKADDRPAASPATS
jgi:hypothetical protein